MLSPSQADRDAAAAVADECQLGFSAHYIRQGKHDDRWLVQAFAKHRLAALEASSRHEPVRQWCSGCKDVREVECYRPDCPTALRLGVDQTSSRQEERLVEALDSVMVGGNHLANALIGKLGGDFAERFPPQSDPLDIMHVLEGLDYDIWRGWSSIMLARAALESPEAQGPQQLDYAGEPLPVGRLRDPIGGGAHPLFAQVLDSHAAVTKAVTPKNEHRGWSITWDYGYFTATGPGYDASYEGEEDGWVGNGNRVEARTRDGVIAEIDAYLEEHPDAAG